MNCKESSFEEKIFQNLLNNGIDFVSDNFPKIGAAVSGGADSVSLLLCLSSLCRKYGRTLYVITVNHRIRSEAESGGDARFVEDLCEKLKNTGTDINFYAHVLEKGEVDSVSQKRKCGTEEAARFLRYGAFEQFREKFNLDYIFLAHNENDNLETILMRFLQGSLSSGIREKRDFYVRPLINITRNEIECYLNEKKQDWRTDKTNFDESYLRNRIRGSLVPLLNEKFPGWNRAVFSRAEKDFLDEDYFKNEIKKISPVQENDFLISYERQILQKLHKAVLYRLIFSSFSELKVQGRIPYRSVMDFINRLQNGENYNLPMGAVILSCDEKTVLIKKPQKIATESSFFAIIEESGQFDFPFGALSVETQKNGAITLIFDGCELKDVRLPVIVRSRQTGDRIKTSSGQWKSVNDILADWHVPDEQKDMIPLVQDLTESGQNLIAVAGSVLNYKNWIVRG